MNQGKRTKWIFLAAAWGLLAGAAGAQNSELPFSHEIEFGFLVLQGTGMVDLDRECVGPYAALDKVAAEKGYSKEQSSTAKETFRNSLRQNLSSLVYGPDANLEEIFAGFKGDDPERRFLFVVKEGAFIGLMPKRSSRINPSENPFFVKLPVTNSPTYYLKYISRADEKAFFTKVMVAEEKEFELAEVTAIDPEKARPLVLHDLKYALLFADRAYHRRPEIPPPPKTLSREQYAQILEVGSQIKSSDRIFRDAVQRIKTSLAPPSVPPPSQK